MIKQLSPLQGTADLSTWEAEFVKHVVALTSEGQITERLSAKQADVVERLYGKHFGDA